MGLIWPFKEVTKIKLAGGFYPGIIVNNNDPKKLQRVQVRITKLFLNVADEDLPWAMPMAHVLQGNSPTIGEINVPVVGSRVWVYLPDDDVYTLYYFGGLTTSDLQIPELVNGNYPWCYGRIDAAGNLFLYDTFACSVDIWLVTGTRLKVDGSGHTEIWVADNSGGPNATSTLNKGLTINVIGDANLLASGKTNIEASGDVSIVAGGDVDIQAGGTATIIAGEAAVIEAPGGVSVNAQGSANVNCSGEMNINASSINLNSGVTVPPPPPPSGPSSPDSPTPRSRPADTDFSDKTDY